VFILKTINDNGEARLNDIDRETEELGEKYVPVPLCPLQISHELTRA
jgi:hypothetical protein